MTDQTTQLMLHLDADTDTDLKELEELTQQLHQELIELDVEAVDFVSAGETPSKAKAGDPIAWGTLLLTLAASGGVFTTLINVLQSWLSRHKGGGVAND